MSSQTKTLRRNSIHDVARLAGVSAATVSKVMHGVATVRPENAQRVREAIEALDYRVDPFASDLRRSTRRIIGAVVPELESEFFGSMVTALERLAEQRGFALVVATSRESQEREALLIERMNDWRVSGIILAPVRSEHGTGTELLKRFGMTSVLIDRVTADDIFDTVTAAGKSASAEVAHHLLDAGHTHVLLLGLSDVSIAVQKRIEGFKETALARNPAMRVDILLSDGDICQLRSALSAYFSESKPTAIYSLFLKGTLVALTEFRRRAWHCPNDISLVGFDDTEWMHATYPSISAVVQPVEQIAARAIENLFERIEGFGGPARSHFEPCTVMMRESVGPPMPARIGGEKIDG